MVEDVNWCGIRGTPCICKVAALITLETLAANTAGCMRAAVATATDQATEMFEGKARIRLSHLFGFGSERERGKASALCSVWYEALIDRRAGYIRLK